jgi:hypothetical protein
VCDKQLRADHRPFRHGLQRQASHDDTYTLTQCSNGEARVTTGDTYGLGAEAIIGDKVDSPSS